MSFITCVLCLCTIFSIGYTEDEKHILVPQNTQDTSSPLKFPKISEPGTPIVYGDNPKSSKLPPKMFPIMSPEHNETGPPVLNGSEANITEIKNNNEHNTHKASSDTANPGSTVNSTKSALTKDIDKEKGEQEDMLHSLYKGGQDVDELLKPGKKATEKDEKKSSVPKKEPKKESIDPKKDSIEPKKESIEPKKESIEPKSEVDVVDNFDKNGPKLMNETKDKQRESILESTSKMMAVSSSVLSSTQPRHHGIIEPVKTFVSVLLSAAVILCLGVIGLLVWKRIAQRRFGRDVLINEDDMDDVSDMHTFESAQIQIT